MAIKVSGTTVIDDSRNLQNTVNVNATGNAYANTFIGDGSQLTNLPAGGSSTELVASGTLSDGSAVIINADGTASIVAQGTGTATPGSASVFEAAVISDAEVVYDSTNQKIVVAYVDDGNSYSGTAVVGTVSGSSITFGTPATWGAANVDSIGMAYDSTAGQVVIVYRQTSSGKSVVGTVSGTSISFGSVSTFNSNNCTQNQVVYDASQNRLVVFYRDNGNSSYGTSNVGYISSGSVTWQSQAVFWNSSTVEDIRPVYHAGAEKIVLFYKTQAQTGHAIVGTVSAGSITFGSSTTVNSNFTYQLSAVYDASTQKVVVFYRDDGNSQKPTAKVGTVSGTSISFGSSVTNGGSSSRLGQNGPAYDPTNERVIWFWIDKNVSKTYVSLGQVSGTSISFGTATQLPSTNWDYVSAAYDTNAQRFVVVYRDYDNSRYGTALAAETTTTNLTSENFIGISNGAYANGATATIQLVGATDDAQSGLTTGSLHYVLANGSISTSAGSPSVVAGLALSSTTLAIKAQ